MKIRKSEAYSALSFVVFCFTIGLTLIEVFSSIGWLDPNQHLEHWFVAILLALYLPQLWRDSIPPKKSSMYQNALRASAYRKGQRAEQMARGMAGTDAYRDDIGYKVAEGARRADDAGYQLAAKALCGGASVGAHLGCVGAAARNPPHDTQ